MSDEFNQKPGDGADGWVDDVDPYAQTEFGLEAVDGPSQTPQPPAQPQQVPPPPQQPRPPQSTQLAPPQQYAPAPPKDPHSVEDGKVMAFVAHAGILLGIPTFLVPMLQRENEYALHHAKAAAVNYMFFVVSIFIILLIAFVTCGIGAIFAPVVYVPMVVGMVNVANGERASAWAWGGIGERMFSGLTVKDDRPQLPE